MCLTALREIQWIDLDQPRHPTKQPKRKEIALIEQELTARGDWSRAEINKAMETLVERTMSGANCIFRRYEDNKDQHVSWSCFHRPYHNVDHAHRYLIHIKGPRKGRDCGSRSPDPYSCITFTRLVNMMFASSTRCTSASRHNKTSRTSFLKK